MVYVIKFTPFLGIAWNMAHYPIASHADFEESQNIIVSNPQSEKSEFCRKKSRENLSISAELYCSIFFGVPFIKTWPPQDLG